MKLPALPFGHAVRAHWLLDPELVYLNHGTVGVTPRTVLESQWQLMQEIESNPSEMLLRDISAQMGDVAEPRVRRAAARVAEFVGASGRDLAFLSNATAGANVVLRSLDLVEGDEVLITDTTYGGVEKAVQFTCRPGQGRQKVVVKVVDLPCPIESPEEVLSVFERAITPRTRLAVIDHIVSETGVVLPVAELTSLCHERGVPVLIDGAHAPGQLELDIPSLGAEWYVANLHKWAFAPRSCGILWAREDARENLHPNVISWPLDEGFPVEFDWTGTRDLSPWLSAPVGLEFLEALGFEELRRYNHELLWSAVSHLGERWGGESLAARPMTAFMAAVSLPDSFPARSEVATRLRDRLLYEHRIEVPIFCYRERLWARLSMQVYNELSDVERFADALQAMLP